MKKTVDPAKYRDFKTFYTELVEPLKKANPEWLRLDGTTESGTRIVFGHFQYKGIIWKVDSDTDFEKLKIAFEKFQETEEPFEIKPTKDNKGECLTIVGEPAYGKKFYVYATDLKHR